MLSIRLQTINTNLIFFEYLSPLKFKYHDLTSSVTFQFLKIPLGNFLSYGFLFLFVFTASNLQAQNFSLNLTKTDETCSANGSITITTENATPDATITYSIYLLPSTTPMAIISTGYLERLSSGTYRVVATQSNPNVSAIQDIEIERQLVPLEYAITGTNITCGNLGSITVEVFSGTAAFYEIISGPVTAAPQAEPVFNNLPMGEYRVRVTDNCGQGAVMTYSLFQVTPELSISAVSFPVNELPNCSSIIASHQITPARNTNLTYPLYATYTVTPPGSATPIVVHNTIPSGDPESYTLQTAIPFYYGQLYTYDIQITDNCTNSFTKTITVNQKLKAGLTRVLAYCGSYSLQVNPANFVPPFSVVFLANPTTFDPDASASGSGPYYAPVTYGDFNNPVPLGTYRIQVTDACGKTEIGSVAVAPQVLLPTVLVEPLSGCNSGKSNVNVSLLGRKISMASMLEGPTAFAATFPQDITSSINAAGKLILNNLPTGLYKLTLTDVCGENFIAEFSVPPMETKITTHTSPSCTPGKGSLRFFAHETTLQSVFLISAPSGYPGANSDLSRYINRNASYFSINDLLPGTYRFRITNNCNITILKDVIVKGYEVITNTANITEHCGSFDITFSHVSNSASTAFWLQKLNPVTGTWGHPQTGNPFPAGTRPTALNSFALRNNATTYNIGYNGNFRILKYFESCENGDIALIRKCFDVIHEFSFFGVLEIMGVEKTNCNGLNSDIRINAVGSPPLTYEIESKDGLPFYVSNGNNPLFTNLEPGVYKFKVIDACTNFTPRTVDIRIIPAILSEILSPGPLVGCENANNDSKADFDLRLQNPKILGTADQSLYNITYHLSENEAITNTNALPLSYTSGNATLHARIQYNNRTDCYGIVSFNLVVNETRALKMPRTYFICPEGNVTITADSGFLHYAWSTGEQNTNEITINKPGTFSVIVTESTNGFLCSRKVDFEVLLSEIATINNIEVKDWTNDQNSIIVHINQQSGQYSYSLDNINFQDSNTFIGLLPGDYIVYIKDNNGCDSTPQEVTLLDYPRYFTPNNDGFNDVWKISNSHSEPNIKLSVFDRYGRLVKVLQGNNSWDGTVNGQQLPADDYWFVITRENGKTFRGHFSLKR